jgi:hypothetical protein
MYIDLLRAYLLQYGSQRALARALGVSDAYLSLLLEPLRLPGGGSRKLAYWADAARWPRHDLAEALRALKSPSLDRARQLVDRLCSDEERREVLLYHVSQASASLRPTKRAEMGLSAEEGQQITLMLGAMHHAALHSSDANAARSGYAQVWDAARVAAALIDERLQPLEAAQILLILHDAACILNRFDLALRYARRAILILDEPPNPRASDERIRLRTNAAVAEALALNNLGLQQEALVVVERAKALPGYRVESESWLRSFLEQRLRSLERMRRASIYDAERTAEQARELVADDPILIAGVEARLADVYLAHPSPRSLRLAQALVERLLAFSQREGGTPPLRRVLALRTAARYFEQTGDCPMRADLLRRCMDLADAAGLAHQRTKVEREYETATQQAAASQQALQGQGFGKMRACLAGDGRVSEPSRCGCRSP